MDQERRREPGNGHAGPTTRAPGGRRTRERRSSPARAAGRATGRWQRGASDGGLPWRSTVLIAVVVMAGTGFAAAGQPDREALDALGRALLLLGAAPLLLRHRRPVAVVFGVAAVTLGYLLAGYPYGPVFALVAVACFAAVVHGHRTAAAWALGLLWAGHLLLAHWLYRWLPPAGDGRDPWGQELPAAAFAVAVLAASETVRVRREQRAQLRADRAAAERRRADEERLRIARELHDVLAHSISVINVQAGVGLALLDSDPEQARTALTTIKAASKEALGEVRQVLDTLRTRGDAPRAPAPGLGRLPELVEQAAAAGLTVTVATAGPRAELPAGADLAAFRVVQEALTNVVRHSGSRTARVRLGYGSRQLDLTVDDDGPATGTEAGGSGNGLAGMRERAAGLGGTIEAGARPDGGFRVHAVLPFRREDPPPPQETP
ncbi:sensor histidine kinase [Streptomyces sp. NPDC014891]|uniref:sensor histidine kinase n=1 Tax=Streptomyces sp. NPDC014891 TaxID=3364929 RepID=UPI0036F6B69E